MPTNDERIEQARRRGKQYALAVFVLLATAFIVSSTWQIMAAVFGFSMARAGAGESATSPACGAAIRDLQRALDRARVEAAAAHDEAEAAQRFDRAIDPSVDAALDAHCSGAGDDEPRAAALRLRSASEAGVRRLARETGRVEADVDRFLPSASGAVPGAAGTSKGAVAPPAP